jgi:hypothetical protein
MLCVVVVLAADELGGLHERIAGGSRARSRGL